MYFQITLVSQCHLSMPINKNCATYVNDLSIGPCLCYIQEDVSVLCTVTPLTKWNLPVPCNIGRKTRCVLQNWNGIFPASELSFMRSFMNELMTDWWQIIKTIFCFFCLYLFRLYFGLLFKLTLNQGFPTRGPRGNVVRPAKSYKS